MPFLSDYVASKFGVVGLTLPLAVRRIHAGIGEDPDLQTTAESSARAALAELDEEYQVRRASLLQRANWQSN